MALLKVKVNGETFIVDAPNKATAKSFGKKQLKVEVEELGVADLQGLDAASVIKVEPQSAAEPEAAAEEAAAA